MRQPQTATQWFATALSWKADDEPSAYGLALSRNDLGDKAGLEAVQRNWSDKSERIAQLGRPELAQAPSRRQVPASSRPAVRQRQADAAMEQE